MVPSADDLDRMTDREARAVWAAEARSLRTRLNDLNGQVRDWIRSLSKPDLERLYAMRGRDCPVIRAALADTEG